MCYKRAEIVLNYVMTVDTVVRVREIALYLRENSVGVVDRKLLLSLQPVREANALDCLHDEVDQIVLLPDEVQRDDVRMRELRDRLGFPPEPLEHRRSEERRVGKECRSRGAR